MPSSIIDIIIIMHTYRRTSTTTSSHPNKIEKQCCCSGRLTVPNNMNVMVAVVSFITDINRCHGRGYPCTQHPCVLHKDEENPTRKRQSKDIIGAEKLHWIAPSSEDTRSCWKGGAIPAILCVVCSWILVKDGHDHHGRPPADEAYSIRGEGASSSSKSH